MNELPAWKIIFLIALGFIFLLCLKICADVKKRFIKKPSPLGKRLLADNIKKNTRSKL